MDLWGLTAPFQAPYSVISSLQAIHDSSDLLLFAKLYLDLLFASMQYLLLFFRVVAVVQYMVLSNSLT